MRRNGSASTTIAAIAAVNSANSRLVRAPAASTGIRNTIATLADTCESTA